MSHLRLDIPVLVLLLVTAMPVPAQQPAPAPPAPGAPAASAPAEAKLKPDELEQIAAPIALYPDPVVAQVFMASTDSPGPTPILRATRSPRP